MRRSSTSRSAVRIEEARDSGLDKLIVVTSKGKDTIFDHFDRTAELERSLRERGKDELLAEVDAVSRMVDLIAVRQRKRWGWDMPCSPLAMRGPSRSRSSCRTT